jgi:hypothetical protein
MFDSRMDMARGFDALMNRTYRLRKEYQKHEYQENLVKTHILELHSGGKLLESKTHLHDMMHQLASRSGVELVSTSDWHFFGLAKSGFSAYVEMIDDRYALLHSASRAEAVEQYVQGITRDLPYVDQAWFPSDFLESAKSTGAFRGFRLRHDNWLTTRHRGKDRDLGVRRFSMNLSLTDGAEETLAQLRQIAALQGAVNVAGVELRVQERGTPERFALSDVLFTSTEKLPTVLIESLTTLAARANRIVDHPGAVAAG